MRRLGGRLREVATYKTRTELGGGRVLLGKSQDMSALWKITSLRVFFSFLHNALSSILHTANIKIRPCVIIVLTRG